MRNIKLTIAYDGTRYFGWQKTSTGPSIEEEIEKVLHQVLQETVFLQAASRTDAGVHAHGQVANFKCGNLIEAHKLHISLCSLLPKDIAVLCVDEVGPDFHPTLHVKGKEYRYKVSCGTAQLPQERLYAWHVPYELNVIEMRKAGEHLIGEHDFSAFCNVKKNETYEDHRRAIESIHVIESENGVEFRVRGNHFLYKMVRNIVGTLVYVGRGKLQADGVPAILAGKDRTVAGMTAPACGLSLWKVEY